MNLLYFKDTFYCQRNHAVIADIICIANCNDNYCQSFLACATHRHTPFVFLSHVFLILTVFQHKRHHLNLKPLNMSLFGDYGLHGNYTYTFRDGYDFMSQVFKQWNRSIGRPPRQELQLPPTKYAISFTEVSQVSKMATHPILITNYVLDSFPI